MATKAEHKAAYAKQVQRGKELRAAYRAERRARRAWRETPVYTETREKARAKLREARERVREAELRHADAKRKVHDTKPAPVKPLRERALDQAIKKIGVMEVGANNRGARVEEIIRYAHGQVPEAWCVDFVIWCYGHAGSSAIKPGFTRAVRFMWPAAGVEQTHDPKPGDVIRYTFDHTGLFVRDRGDGTIETIEGNTGASGAVSDSSTGGDGVYRKVRSKSLVRDYLRVTR